MDDAGWNSASEQGVAGSLCADRAAAIWREHRGWVAAWLHGHKPRGVEVDDLLQEVAVTLVKHIDTIDSPERIGPWLRTVALNVVRDASRRQSVHQRTFTETSSEHAAPQPSDDDDSRARGRAALQIAESLPHEYREPLLLSLRGLSYRQISRVLELPVTTIETRLFRARKMVREELAATDRLMQQKDAIEDGDRGLKFDVNKAAQASRVTHE